MTELHNVVAQNWEESERGWGVRPDGCTIHPDEPARLRYVKAYWDKMPDEVPDEYSRPAGNAYIKSVNDEIFEKLKSSGDGMWL